MPDIAGIGFEGKSDLIKVMRELAESPVQADACGCWCMPVLLPE
jgi:hypothetical protein